MQQAQIRADSKILALLVHRQEKLLPA